MDRSAVIEKPSPEVSPNLLDYASGRAAFSWAAASRALDGLPGGRGLNIAHEAVDRHANGALADRVALRCIAKDGRVRDLTYRELKEATNRFANALVELGVTKGERVFVLSNRIPELYVACLGTLKAGAVFSPLFSAFGPEPIAARIGLGEGRVLVTTAALYAKKVASVRERMTSLRHVVIVGEDGAATAPGTLDFRALLADASPVFEIPPTDPEDMAILHFTSGTTGKPKGAIHVHAAVIAHHVTGSLALDLHPEDVFWCTADPGWVTGTSYGIIAPLTQGITSIVDEAEFDADRWYAILRDQKVSVWYTAPTAVRMLMRVGKETARGYALPRLRFVASVGEPLNPEAVYWGIEALGLPIHDNWWQTETGGIMVANYASMPIRPGSMGRPLPGIDAAVVTRRPDGSVRGHR